MQLGTISSVRFLRLGEKVNMTEPYMPNLWTCVLDKRYLKFPSLKYNNLFYCCNRYCPEQINITVAFGITKFPSWWKPYLSDSLSFMPLEYICKCIEKVFCLK